MLDGRIHAVGGNAAQGVDLEAHDHGLAARDRSVGTHEVYDPARNTWARLEPMLTARNHLGAAAIAGKIHVVGGRVPGDMELTTHEIYDPETDTWTEGPPMPTGRSGIAVVAHRGRLYVFGGGDRSKILLQDLRRSRAVRSGDRPLGAATADAHGETRPRRGVVR